ncbi:hypothetical protein JYU34_000166 [Plutella xylostella]|uniref:Uncharacterized protein n=1 Tax=Plutella xylostella TaxID=51655 RepID=A0ABQ7R708_PLUXY|nr:hypothetical protein JYU34_000166 [Plutella xylostella]
MQWAQLGPLCGPCGYRLRCRACGETGDRRPADKGGVALSPSPSHFSEAPVKWLKDSTK